MIKTPTRTQQPHRAGSESQESLERAFAHKLTQRLGGQDPALGAQVERRLSAARWQAVEAATRARRARVTARAAALATSSGPGVFSVWWVRLASFVPPLALTLGLIGIDQLNLTQRIEAAAEGCGNQKTAQAHTRAVKAAPLMGQAEGFMDLQAFGAA